MMTDGWKKGKILKRYKTKITALFYVIAEFFFFQIYFTFRYYINIFLNNYF